MDLVTIFKKMVSEQTTLKKQMVLAEQELVMLNYLIEEMSGSDKKKMQDLKKRRASLVYRIEQMKERYKKLGTEALQSSKDALKNNEDKLKKVETELKKYEDIVDKEKSVENEPETKEKSVENEPETSEKSVETEPETTKEFDDKASELENKTEELEKNIKDKSRDLATMSSNAEDIQNNIEQLKGDSGALDGEIKAHQSKGEELETNKQELEIELKKSEEEQKEIDNKVSAAETEIKELEKEKEQIEKEKEQIEKEKEEQIEKEKEEVADRAVAVTTNNAKPSQGLNDVPANMSSDKETAKEDFQKNVKKITDDISIKLEKTEKKSFPREAIEAFVGKGFSMMQALLNVVQIDSKGFGDIFVETPGKILGGVYNNYTEIEKKKLAKRMGPLLKNEYSKIANNLKISASKIEEDDKILKSYEKTTKALQSQAKKHVDIITKLDKQYEEYLVILGELEYPRLLDDDEIHELTNKIKNFEENGLNIDQYIETKQKAEEEIKKIDKTVEDEYNENAQFFIDAAERKKEYNELSKAKDNIVTFLDDAKDVAWNGFDKNEFKDFAEEYEEEKPENNFEVGYDYERESKSTVKLAKQLEKMRKKEKELQDERAEEEKRDKDMRDTAERERLEDLEREKEEAEKETTDSEDEEIDDSETDEEIDDSETDEEIDDNK